MQTFEQFLLEDKRQIGVDLSATLVYDISFKKGDQEMFEETWKNWLAAGLIGASTMLPSDTLAARTQPQMKLATTEIREFITKHEGKRNKTYLDSLGIPTVGIGFNLKRPDARTLFKKIGANYDTVLAGRSQLTDAQITQLLDYDIAKATQIAKGFINNFNIQPPHIQKVLIDMAFNMGEARLSQFKRFKAALEKKDYITASKEMKNSKWYRQVKNRGIELVRLMRNESFHVG